METRTDATLSWDAQRGFQLDLSANEEGVQLKLRGVPVPADGTVELGEGVELDRLEILFKAQVDVDQAPGQLTEATVRLLGEGRLGFDAVVEDAETGDVRDVKLRVPVTIEGRPPEKGGPRAEATREEDLDWDDETTYEHLFHEPTSEEAPREKPQADGAATGQRGFEALLRAIQHAGDDMDQIAEAVESTLPQDAQKKPAPAPTRQPEPMQEPVVSGDMEARGLLEFLIEREALELADDHELDELIEGVSAVLMARRNPEGKAKALSEWLLDQPAVEELYIDDEQLAELLERW